MADEEKRETLLELSQRCKDLAIRCTTIYVYSSIVATDGAMGASDTFLAPRCLPNKSTSWPLEGGRPREVSRSRVPRRIGYSDTPAVRHPIICAPRFFDLDTTPERKSARERRPRTNQERKRPENWSKRCSNWQNTVSFSPMSHACQTLAK